MKIRLKDDDYDIEFDPEEVPDAVIERLIDAINHGLPVGNDVVETILRTGMGNTEFAKRCAEEELERKLA